MRRMRGSGGGWRGRERERVLPSQVVTLPHMASSITLANQAASRSEGALIARHLEDAGVRGTIRKPDKR